MLVSLRSTAVDLFLSDNVPLLAYLAQWAPVLSRPSLTKVLDNVAAACMLSWEMHLLPCALPTKLALLDFEISRP